MDTITLTVRSSDGNPAGEITFAKDDLVAVEFAPDGVWVSVRTTSAGPGFVEVISVMGTKEQVLKEMLA